MKTKVLGSLIIGLAISFSAKAQEAVPKFKQDNMLWFGYYSGIVVNPKWSVNTDIQLRTKNWYKDWSQALIRPGLSYKVNEKFTVTAGVAHFRFFITNTLTRGEWRPWQEISFHDKVGKIKLTHRFRFEQRFNQKVLSNEPINDYQFNYRFRYKFDVQFPIKEEGANGNNLFVLFGNEVMVNAGGTSSNNFDQDRLSVGLGYSINKKVSFQVQYMHIWQLLSNGITISNMEVIRFNIYHRIIL